MLTKLCGCCIFMSYKILTYEQIDRTEWSRLVRTSATGTWFQTPEAYMLFASMPDLFRPFIVGVVRPEYNSGLINEETLRGVCVGYVTVERNPIKQYFTRRAIVIGGPCLADDCTAEEVETLLCAFKSTLLSGMGQAGSPIYIETRNFNDYSRWKGAFGKAGFEYKRHLNFHVDCTDKGKMWERLSENRKRQIRKVTNERVKELTNEGVRELRNEGVSELRNEGVSEQDVWEWYAILSELYRTKVKTPLWPVEFFIEAYRKGIGQFMLVRHEGKVIGGSMVVRDEKTVYEWFECGLNAEYKELYPSVIATYAGIEYAAGHGYTRYDMMGAGKPGVPYGVRDFKAEFGGEMVEQGRFLCICHPILYKLGVLGVKILRKS